MANSAPVTGYNKKSPLNFSDAGYGILSVDGKEHFVDIKQNAAGSLIIYEFDGREMVELDDSSPLYAAYRKTPTSLAKRNVDEKPIFWHVLNENAADTVVIPYTDSAQQPASLTVVRDAAGNITSPAVGAAQYGLLAETVTSFQGDAFAVEKMQIERENNAQKVTVTIPGTGGKHYDVVYSLPTRPGDDARVEVLSHDNGSLIIGGVPQFDTSKAPVELTGINQNLGGGRAVVTPTAEQTAVLAELVAYWNTPANAQKLDGLDEIGKGEAKVRAELAKATTEAGVYIVGELTGNPPKGRAYHRSGRSIYVSEVTMDGNGFVEGIDNTTELSEHLHEEATKRVKTGVTYKQAITDVADEATTDISTNAQAIAVDADGERTLVAKAAVTKDAIKNGDILTTGGVGHSQGGNAPKPNNGQQPAGYQQQPANAQVVAQSGAIVHINNVPNAPTPVVAQPNTNNAGAPHAAPTGNGAPAPMQGGHQPNPLFMIGAAVLGNMATRLLGIDSSTAQLAATVAVPALFSAFQASRVNGGHFSLQDAAQYMMAAFTGQPYPNLAQAAGMGGQAHAHG